MEPDQYSILRMSPLVKELKRRLFKLGQAEWKNPSSGFKRGLNKQKWLFRNMGDRYEEVLRAENYKMFGFEIKPFDPEKTPLAWRNIKKIPTNHV